MKKIIIPITIILFLIITGWFIFISTINYSNVQKDIEHMLSTNGINKTTIEKFDISKFPFPKIYLQNVTVDSAMHCDEIEVVLDFRSIFTKNPRISNVILRHDDDILNIAMHYKDGSLKYGKATANISNLGIILSKYPDLSEALNTIVPSEKTTITFDLVNSEDYLGISNIIINSASITAKGEGLISHKETIPDQLKIECDKVKFYNDELQKISILLSSNKESLHIESMEGEILSGGHLTLSGDITNDNDRSVFLGNINVNHSNINKFLKNLHLEDLMSSNEIASSITANIKITAVELSMKNIVATLGDLEISGNNSIKFIGNQPRMSSDLKIVKFDSDKELPIFSPLKNYILSLKDGMKDQSYQAKFIPLRTIKYITNFDIDIENPLISTTNLDFIKISGQITSGKLSVDSFEYKKGDDYLKGNFDLSTTIVMPKLQFNISSGNFNMDFFDIQKLLDVNKTIMENYDLSKVKFLTNINLDKISYKNKFYTNIKSEAHNKDNSLIVSNISFNDEDANFTGNGGILLSLPLSFNLGYAYNSFNLIDIIDDLVIGLDINGVISSNGIISSHGSSVEELLYNLYIKSDFLGDTIKINGYDIDNFITKINNLNYNEQAEKAMMDYMRNMAKQKSVKSSPPPSNNLDKDAEDASLDGSTVLSKINGSINMNLGNIIIKDTSFETKNSTGKLKLSYNIYNQDFHLQSDINFPLNLTAQNNTDSGFSIILENNNNFFEKFIDLKRLKTDFQRRPPSAYRINNILN